MTADTYSNTLGYLIMGTGNDNNIWGVNANSAVFQIIEDAIANALTSTVTGGTLDLSGSPPPAAASQTRYAALIFNGTLSSNQLVKVPNLTKRWQVYNATSGAFVLQLQTPSGNPILIPQGMYCDVWCDGSNDLIRVGSNTGQFVTHGATSPPAGAVICDGTAYSRSIYSELYAIIGTIWGVGNGTTTFNVPNTQDTARFLRSSGAGFTVGTYQANQNKTHTHTGSVSGATSGESVDHSHTVSGNTGGQSVTHTHSAQGVVAGNVNTGANPTPVLGPGIQNTSVNSVDHSHAYSGTTSGVSADHSHNFSASFTTSAGSADGTEARPESAVVLMCIWI
jgi:microcystin-dependent protein